MRSRSPIATLLAVVAALFAVGGLVASAVLNRSDADSAEDAATAAGSTQDASQDASQETATPTAEVADAGLTEAPPILAEAAALTGIDGWINTEGGAEVPVHGPGPVRVVQFWTFTCYNCKNTLPYLQDLYAEQKPNGLEMIGIHSPEFEREKDPEAVAAAAVDLGVTWPIALDTNKENFRSWQGRRRYWPRTYVIDQNGQIRFDHIGEGAYSELVDTVAYLIENGP